MAIKNVTLPDSFGLPFKELNFWDGMVISVKKLLGVDITLKAESERSECASRKNIFQKVSEG